MDLIKFSVYLGSSTYGNLVDVLIDQGHLVNGWVFKAKEHEIYGSSRLGVHQTDLVLIRRLGTNEKQYTAMYTDSFTMMRGKRHYELSNHLGNVQVVISDKRIAICDEGEVESFEAEILMATDYYPFGMVMPDRQYYANSDTSGYRFGFNGMEKDNEVKGTGNSLDFGARIYDSRLGRWLSVDPMYYDYLPVTPFGFALNNPIYFGDPDGKKIVDPFGKEVTYTRDANGGIVWSPNVTNEILEIANAMLTTEFGEAAFQKWINSETIVHLKIDSETITEEYAETEPTENMWGMDKKNKDGQYEEITVTVFSKSIERDIQSGSNTRLEDASYQEALGMVATHEVFHNEKEQIKNDRRKPEEEKQSPEKNLPVNAEINFRTEYHKKYPGQKNEASWKKKYDERGYKGLDESGKPVSDAEKSQDQ